MKLQILICLSLLTIVSMSSVTAKTTAPTLSPQERTIKSEGDITALIQKMTIEEKVAQMQGLWLKRREFENDNGEFLPEIAQPMLAQGIGHIGRPAEKKEVLTDNKNALDTVTFTNTLQQWLQDNTRTGIPAMFHGETLHGHMAEDATVFPQSIALASSWDPALFEEIFSVVAKETRARGVGQALSPVLDVAKDPRWGRIEETYGEDPYLIAQLGIAAVTGLQGAVDASVNGKLPGDKVLATLKHLAGHGYPMGGLNIAPAMMGERYLREQILPPFEQVVRKLDVGSVMASYNEIDGVPSHANAWLLNDVLRGEWGFKGSVVSDYFAIDELKDRHGLVGNYDDAGQLALNAGVDIELPDAKTYKGLVGALAKGEIKEALLDQALYRLLRDKYRLGLFDQPFTDEKNIHVIGTEAHKRLSQTAAEESIVLLKNNGILPLDLKTISSVALIGPHVNEVVLGGYSDIPSSSISLAEALKKALPKHIRLSVEPGMQLTTHKETKSEKADGVKSYSKARWNVNAIELVSDEENKASIERARLAAENSDLVILMIGDNEGTSREGWNENHRGDRSSLEFPGSQPLLIDSIISTGKPIVTVLQNGRPPKLSPWLSSFDALLESWYAGERGGAAIANILLGKVNPSGKLPLSFPRNAGQIPVYYNHKPTAKRGYAHEENGPQFAFGFGLSYSDFEYSSLVLKNQKVSINEDIELSFKLKNTSKIDGKEVVQLYIRDPLASVTRPVKELKGFYKVAVSARGEKEISVKLPAKALYFWSSAMKRIIEKGEIELMIGTASDDIKLKTKVYITENGAFENTEYLPFFSAWSVK